MVTPVVKFKSTLSSAKILRLIFTACLASAFCRASKNLARGAKYLIFDKFYVASACSCDRNGGKALKSILRYFALLLYVQIRSQIYKFYSSRRIF